MAKSRLQIIFDLLTKDKLSPDLKKATVESKKLSKGVANVSTRFKTLGKSSGGLLKSVLNLKTAFLAVGAAFAGAKIIRLAQAQEDAINDVNTALKRSGEFSEEASQSIQDWATALQNATTVGDEVILQNFALAKSFGFTADQAKVATQAALELSEAAGISLEESIRRVGRTISGSIEDVSKFAPEIKNLTKAELEAGLAADKLVAALGGTAAAQLNNFSGATAQLGNTFGDLLEQFGNVIIKSPDIIRLIKSTTKSFIALTESLKKNAGQIQEFIAAGFKSFKLFFGFVRQQLIATSIALTSGLQSMVEGFVEFERKVGELTGIAFFKKDADELDAALGKGLLLRLKNLSAAADEIDAKFAGLFEAPEETKVTVDVSRADAGASTLQLKLTDQFEKLALSGIAKGAQGAQALVSGLAGTLADSFLPGLGGAVGEIVGLLSQGPEAVERTVDQFTQALPLIFENIVASLPVLIERLIVGLVDAFVRISERADVIIQAFAEGMARAAPRIAIALALQMPRVGLALAKSMPNAAKAFGESLIDAADDFIDALVEGIKEGIKGIFDVTGSGGILGGLTGSLFGGILGGPLGSIGGAILGGGGGGLVSSVASSFGFADGGVVPSGFPNDSFPARLTTGEGIIRSDLNPKLESFLDNQGGGDMILSQILTELRRPQLASATIELDQRTFGTIILELSRNNVRTVA